MIEVSSMHHHDEYNFTKLLGITHIFRETVVIV